MLKLYNILLSLLRRLWRILPLGRELLEPREGLLDRWRKAKMGENRIWFHVSSVGELEQCRPVLERLKRRGYSLVLSYFSNSVPRLVKDWDFVDHADYLPLDFPDEMEALMEIVSPRLLVLNRYDLWPNHLMAAKKKGVPVVVVNASTPPLGWKGAVSLWVRNALFRAVSAWSFVDAAAAAGWEPFLSERGKGLVTGDPRVDRALGRVEAALREGKAKQRMAQWERKDLTLVAGSTWPEDEEVLLDAWMRLRIPRSLLLVPHEPVESHLVKIEKKLDGLGLSHGRYSALKASVSWDVLLVDERGALAELYGAGNLAFVGGGYHRHIHSIVEPVAHGLPVAFGPRFKRSPEAVALGATDGAVALPEGDGGRVLADWLEKMATNGAARARADEPLRVFLQIHRGAGERVAEFVHSCITEGTHRLS